MEWDEHELKYDESEWDELEWNGYMHLSSIPVHRYGNQVRVTTLNFKLVVHAIKSVNQLKTIKAWPSANLITIMCSWTTCNFRPI